jgi:DNA transposition AAA+ family ATPase
MANTTTTTKPAAKPITLEAETVSDDLLAPVSKSEMAKASSAKSRINIPFNLKNWKGLDESTTEALAWFHSHALETDLTLDECAKAINYSTTTVWRALKGEYGGDLGKVVDQIQSYRTIIAERTAIQNADFCETRYTRLVTGGLSYALANNSITNISGESRTGKTSSAKYWRDQNNHGRTVFVTAPAYGGAKALLKEIAKCLGINRNYASTNMHEAILRAFNENRMLIVDEAHRLLPNDYRSNPVLLEILRDIHDRTRCGLAILTTARFNNAVAKSEYQYEQVLGRIGMPVQLPRDFEWTDISPIVSQYLTGVPGDLRAELLKIANLPGRLGILCETLKFASRIAVKKKQDFTADSVRLAIATRHQMMGEIQYAKK